MQETALIHVDSVGAAGDGEIQRIQPGVALGLKGNRFGAGLALLRAGRFDRQILVDRPDKKARVEILQLHLRKLSLAPDATPEPIAALTPGFTGADLANLLANWGPNVGSAADLNGDGTVDGAAIRFDGTWTTRRWDWTHQIQFSGQGSTEAPVDPALDS